MSEVSLSTYPTTVDIFDRYSDLDATTMAMAEIYKGYIDAGQYETAATYLTNHPDLEACGITAEIINKHSDAIVAVETYLNDTRTYLNQTAGVVSGLITTTGRLQDDINALENDAIITSEEKVIGTLVGYNNCEIGYTVLKASDDPTDGVFNIFGDITHLRDGLIRHPYCVEGLIIVGTSGYPINTNDGTGNVTWLYNNTYKTVAISYTGLGIGSKKLIAKVKYLRETA